MTNLWMKTVLMLALAGWSGVGWCASEGWQRFADRSTNEWLIGDKQSQRLIRRHVPKELVSDVLAGLWGPPNPVEWREDRYFSVSACQAHNCGHLGFFWLDTQSSRGLGAELDHGFDGRAVTLRLGSRDLVGPQIPEPALAAIQAWLGEALQQPEDAGRSRAATVGAVRFLNREGRWLDLPPERFQPEPVFVPPAGGPSFDCAQSTGSLAKLICADSELAALDLRLSAAARSMHLRGADNDYRRQLSRLILSFEEARQSRCSSSDEPKGCLRPLYLQHELQLQHWTPSRR
ncbi:hypothetical protein [Inhella gelatinilytica]|uniref:Uncharacterized protein n=1 Tax=Inhella gelatinilytica TaxID=2795030 RepID=A0A931ITK9_9BURK|nr:hypothetical protein [Inhella gelatinilytica]MBH9551276.1 hypothetical protein [Inhella gelatinilytica]